MIIASAVQFKPRLARSSAEVRDNFRRCEGMIYNEVANLGSQIVVFPELAFTGYSFMSPDEAVVASEAWDGSTYRSMQEVAVSLNTYVAWGYIENDRGTLYNAATVIDPNGKAIVRHRKMNLWGNDFLWASPGRKTADVVQTEIGNLSVVICRDLRDKVPNNIPRLASDEPPVFPGMKPSIVAACVNLGKGGFPSTSWMDFAANNSCVLVVANRWGKEEGSIGFTQDFGHGGSAIIDTNWKVHVNGLKFDADCVVSTVLD